MPYLPPFSVIRAKMRFTTVKGEVKLDVSYDEFVELIRAMLAVVPVDEAWYLRQYPDVATAIKDGKVSSARQHFIHDGYFEGRWPFEIKVDETWYLKENPGVSEHIRAGRLTTAQQHFDHDGYREGRLPFPV